MFSFIFGIILFVLVIYIAATGNEVGRCFLVAGLSIVATATSFISQRNKYYKTKER